MGSERYTRPGEGTGRVQGRGLASGPPPGPPQLGRGAMQGLWGEDWGGQCPGSKCQGWWPREQARGGLQAAVGGQWAEPISCRCAALGWPR